MKGFSGFGNDKKSPAKVSSQSLVDAQAKLDKTELDFRQPGWAIAAKGVHEGIMGLLAKKKKKTSESKENKGDDNQAQKVDADQLKTVSEIMGKTGGGGTGGTGELGDFPDMNAGTGGMHA
tara:strand:+ start:227 stop:589 length:363 start_codon:yes stop_codon:yes gene_type:complete